MRYIISLLLIVNLSFCYSQTLDDYLKTAAENNPALKSSYAEFEASMQSVSQVNALSDANLSFGMMAGSVVTRNGSQRARISLNQMFPWFGTLKLQGDAATLMAEAKYQEFVNQQNELYYSVKKAYYPLFEIQKQIDLQHENLDLLQTTKKIATSSFSNGKGSMADVLRVDLMIEEVQTEIELLELQKQPLTTSFNRLLNRADSSSVVIQDSLELMEIEADYGKDSLEINNPMLKSVDLMIEASALNQDLAKKKSLPQFGVGVDYIIVSPRNDTQGPKNGMNMIMPMVSMSLPIFRAKYKASFKESELIKSSLEYKKRSIENMLYTDYEMAWYELEMNAAMLDLYENQIKQSTQILNLLYTTYSNSGRDFVEILRTEQEILKYKMAQVGATKNFYLAMAQLDFITTKN